MAPSISLPHEGPRGQPVDDTRCRVTPATMIRSTCLILKSEGDSHCLPVGPKCELLRLFSQISLSDLYDFIPLHNEQGRKGLNYSLRRLWSHHYSFKHARLSLWSLSAPIQLEVMPPTLTSHRGLQSLQPVHEAEVLECVLSVHLFLKSLPIAIIGL